jgi:ribosomal protein L36
MPGCSRGLSSSRSFGWLLWPSIDFVLCQWEIQMWKEGKLTFQQSVRRKGGKKGPGNVYIICSLNPKHKQRQGK